METLLSNRGRLAITTIMILLANMTLALGVGENSVRITTFHLIETANSINYTSVNKTYGRTGSVQHCGMRCANIMAPSFYFEKQTSTCHCTKYYDPDIEEETGSGSITYGLMMAEETGYSTCQVHPDDSQKDCFPECQALYDSGAREDGVYNDSSGEQIFCNLTSLGWVVFQRRLDGSIDFYRNWTEYVDGFGNPKGEFWLGLETMHQVTKNGCELHIYIAAEPNNTVQYKGYARYSSFSVSNATDNYRLQVSGYSGNIGNSLASHNGHMFSTYDVDNDIWSGNCAELYGGAWWFHLCFGSHLNGAYLTGGQPAEYAKGIIWQSLMGFNNSLRHSEMAYRC